MWFADIICDVDWFEGRQGFLGAPQLRQELLSGEAERLWMCVFGTDKMIQHVRMLLDVTTYEEASVVVNRNLSHWTAVLAAATALTAGKSTTPEVFPSTNNYAVILGEGDESAESVSLKAHREPRTVDYAGLAACLNNWMPDSTPYLFYLSRFLDETLSIDVRWLNGYRVAEWHFQRGTGKLFNNEQWRALLNSCGAELELHMRPGQSRQSYIEEARALTAHALLDARPVDERLRKAEGPVLCSFATIERIVMHIANSPDVRRGAVVLQPKT